MRYHLTEAARQDVREITEYIRRVQKSPQNARLVATRLKAALEKAGGNSPSSATSTRNSATSGGVLTRSPG